MEEDFQMDEGKMNQRTSTGVQELDDMLAGGFPTGGFIVVTGTPGTGKSIFGMQFLTDGLQKDEKCLYISVEQPKSEIISQAWQFGWDYQNWENQGQLKIIALNSTELFEMQKINEIKNLIQENHYNRVVIDSITSFIYAPISGGSIADGAMAGMTPSAFQEICRSNASSLIDAVKQVGITAVGIAQKIEGQSGDTVDNVSEFKGDGLIVMNAAAVGQTMNRTIQVKKLRKTRIDGIPHSFEFMENGIRFQS